MNGKERFLAALRGERPDRTPVAHVAALTTVELQQATGCPMPEVHLDAGQLAQLCYANHEVLGFDAVTFNINYSPGCAISPRCPNANFQAMVHAVIQSHANRSP